MNDKLGCVCGWEPSQAQREKIAGTYGISYWLFFREHLQDKHYLPEKWSWDQVHKLLDKLDAEWHK